MQRVERIQGNEGGTRKKGTTQGMSGRIRGGAGSSSGHTEGMQRSGGGSRERREYGEGTGRIQGMRKRGRNIQSSALEAGSTPVSRRGARSGTERQAGRCRALQGAGPAMHAVPQRSPRPAAPSSVPRLPPYLRALRSGTANMAAGEGRSRAPNCAPGAAPEPSRAEPSPPRAGRRER